MNHHPLVEKVTIRDHIHSACSALAMGGFVAAVTWVGDILQHLPYVPS